MLLLSIIEATIEKIAEDFFKEDLIILKNGINTQHETKVKLLKLQEFIVDTTQLKIPLEILQSKVNSNLRFKYFNYMLTHLN